MSNTTFHAVESESAYWADMIRYISQPTILLDKKQRVVCANNAVLKACGKTEKEIAGKYCYEIFHSPEQTCPAAGCPCQKIIDTNTCEIKEMEMEAYGGFYLVSCTPLFDKNGNLEFVLHIATDITEKKKIEDDLIVKNYLFETSLTATIILDIDGKISQVNPSFMKYFQYRNIEDIVGLSPFVLLKNPETDSVMITEAIRTKGVWEGEIPLLRQDGTDFYSYSFATILYNKNKEKIGYNLSCVDIDFRKKAELELLKKNEMYQQLNEELHNTKQQIQASEEKFRVLVENIPGVVYMCKNDATYTMLFLNETIGQLTGYPAQSFLNGTIHITELYHPDDYEDIFKSVDESLDKNRQFHIIYRIRHKSGEWRWVEEFGRGLYVNNELLSLEGVIFDITSMKTAEVILIEQNFKIANQNEELQKAKVKAEESDRLKSAFLANMSHEIRTPMNAICGFSDLLLDNSLNDDKKQKFVQIIHANSQQLLGIINDIIDISKIEAGQITVSENRFSLNSLFAEIETIFGPIIRNKGLNLTSKKEFTNSESIIKSDDLKIKQILNNLIFNAIKFTRKGYIEIGYYTEKEKLVFYVKDTGIGIPEENFTTVFERFRQIENAGSRNGGTGLGLSISKAYAQLLGGDIWLESTVGEGSTFYFNIDYKPVKIQKKEKKEEITGPPDFSKYTILVAEDDEINFYFISEMLNETNARLIHADNGKEALEICRNNKDVALVLMDIKMPEMDGLTATREIRKFATELPVIAQTAYAFSSDKQTALDSGCTDFIAKPIKKDELIDMINKYLD